MRKYATRKSKKISCLASPYSNNIFLQETGALTPVVAAVGEGGGGGGRRPRGAGRTARERGSAVCVARRATRGPAARTTTLTKRRYSLRLISYFYLLTYRHCVFRSPVVLEISLITFKTTWGRPSEQESVCIVCGQSRYTYLNQGVELALCGKQ